MSRKADRMFRLSPFGRGGPVKQCRRASDAAVHQCVDDRKACDEFVDLDLLICGVSELLISKLDAGFGELLIVLIAAGSSATEVNVAADGIDDGNQAIGRQARHRKFRRE